MPQKVLLPSDVTRYQLDGLQPGTEYRLTLYTLLEGREVATPATVVPTGEGPRGPGQVGGEGMGRGGCPRPPLTLCSLTGPELPVGPVTDLQATELPGQRVRVSWTPVPSATEYRITVRSTQGEADAARPVQTLKFPPSGSDCTLTTSLSSPGSLQPPPVSLPIHLPRRP